MTDSSGFVGRPAWIDLSSSDPAASGAFYARLFGWQVTVSADPQYGGYAMATLGRQGRRRASGRCSRHRRRRRGWSTSAPPTPMRWPPRSRRPAAPSSRRRSTSATRAAWPSSRIPAGAFISAWQPLAMSGFGAGGPNAFGWAELSARGRRPGHPVLRVRLRLDATARSDMPEGGAVHRVPAGGREHRRRHGDERHGARRGAQLLDGLLQRRRCRRVVCRRRSRPAPTRCCRRRTSRAGGSPSSAIRRAQSSGC